MARDWKGYEGVIVLYIPIQPGCWSCHGNPEKLVGVGSFLWSRWARLPSTPLTNTTLQFPPRPVTPTLAQANSFNPENKNGTSLHFYSVSNSASCNVSFLVSRQKRLLGCIWTRISQGNLNCVVLLTNEAQWGHYALSSSLPCVRTVRFAQFPFTEW